MGGRVNEKIHVKTPLTESADYVLLHTCTIYMTVAMVTH